MSGSSRRPEDVRSGPQEPARRTWPSDSEATTASGAPLARRELYYGFKVLFERFEEMWFIDGENDFRYNANYFLRALHHLNIGFKLKQA